MHTESFVLMIVDYSTSHDLSTSWSRAFLISDHLDDFNAQEIWNDSIKQHAPHISGCRGGGINVAYSWIGHINSAAQS